MPSPPAALLAVGAPRPAAKRHGPDRTRACRASASKSRQGRGDEGELLAARLRLLEGVRRAVGTRRLRAPRAAVARRGARHRAIDLSRPAGRRGVAVRDRHLRAGRVGGVAFFGVARGLGQPARHRVREPQGDSSFPRRTPPPTASGARRRRSRIAVSGAAARRLGLFRGRVRPAAGRRQRRVPSASCTGSPTSSARSSIRFSGSRRWPTATASRGASARCSTTSSTPSPTRFC